MLLSVILMYHAHINHLLTRKSVYISQVIDLALNVNVEFMLCPTRAMQSAFSIAPPWVLFPTYRTLMTLIVFMIGPLISQIYIYAAKSVLYLKYNLSSHNHSYQAVDKKKI